MKVGPAHAIATARGAGNADRFITFDQQAREMSCATQIKGDSPVGGDNRAVSLDMISSASPFKPTDKAREYPDITTCPCFAGKSGPWKGTARGVNPFAKEAERRLTIDSADARTDSVEVDFSSESGRVRGELKAEVCRGAG